MNRLILKNLQDKINAPKAPESKMKLIQTNFEDNHGLVISGGQNTITVTFGADGIKEVKKETASDVEQNVDEMNIIEKELKPIFFGNIDDVRTFLKEIDGAESRQIVEKVNKYIREKRISDISCNKRLWSILTKYDLYDKSLSNWNDQIIR